MPVTTKLLEYATKLLEYIWSDASESAIVVTVVPPEGALRLI